VPAWSRTCSGAYGTAKGWLGFHLGINWYAVSSNAHRRASPSSAVARTPDMAGTLPARIRRYAITGCDSGHEIGSRSDQRSGVGRLSGRSASLPPKRTRRTRWCSKPRQSACGTTSNKKVVHQLMRRHVREAGRQRELIRVSPVYEGTSPARRAPTSSPQVGVVYSIFEVDPTRANSARKLRVEEG